ncbi:MAG TPA: hypothetical protein VIT21_04905 [Chthoniobacterales bacterium]
MNRLSAHRLPDVQPNQRPAINGHEAIEVSFCDEGMCFLSDVRHEIGAVLLVDFAPEAEAEAIPGSGEMLQSEGVVVDCVPCGQRKGSYRITLLFMGES